jgi:AraC-like DNA-binding protein
MDRRNGTSQGCYNTSVQFPFAWYREFAPCKALQADVYAFFSFVPGAALTSPSRPLLREIALQHTTLCAPQFADGHVSLMFQLGHTCDPESRWHVDSSALRGTVIGPMRGVGRTEGFDLPETVGAYFRPARVAPFFGVAISELTDSVVAIGDVWGTSGSRLSNELCDLSQAARIDRLESVLLTRLRDGRHRTGALDVPGLAATVLRMQGRVSVEEMARAAGVSRQHLSREFRERIGIGPKLYSRLARFRAALAYAGSRTRIDWAGVALDMGFTDQSHMIAEFRQFSGLTPQALANGEWFHPFVEWARSRPM